MGYKQKGWSAFTQPEKKKVGPIAEPNKPSLEEFTQGVNDTYHRERGMKKASIGLNESGVKPNALGQEGRRNYNKYLQSLNKK